MVFLREKEGGREEGEREEGRRERGREGERERGRGGREFELSTVPPLVRYTADLPQSTSCPAVGKREVSSQPLCWQL